MNKTILSADYVIVGAGSAGCALAWRLAEAGCEVLIIEHGGSDGGVFINMPAALSYPMNMSRYDWGYRTEAEVHLGGRRLACPRGKVIGGSSSINGMVFVRGNRQDYDHWEESGADGWSYADVLPYFMRMETAHGGQAGWRGEEGPLHVTFGRRQNPLYNAFIAAGVEAGFPQTADCNGEKQEGFCHLQQTVWGGRRWSAASAYLRPALKLPNVRLLQALARRVIFDKTRARAVEVLMNNTVCTIEARKEIILSASSINSPKMLMLSGVGDAKELKKLDIPIVADRVGVGCNLQDHLELYIQRECLQPITLNRKLDLFSKGLIGAQWLFLRSGDGATNHFEAGAFLKSPDADYPDIQYHFLPAAIRYDGKAAAKTDGFQAHVGHMRSPSRGRVSLNSNRPEDAPRIVFNYMGTDSDWRTFRHCIRLTQDIFSQPAMAQFTGKPISPVAVKQSDEELNDFIRQGVESAYHPCGTCRMGEADDNGAVVDSDCRVIGTEGLRVVDSSIFPRILNGNLNAPSIMVGEKAAAHIIGQKLPPINS